MAKPVIFVVEDQQELRESICEELDERGYSTVGAPHGEKALTLLRKTPAPPSLILLDLLMPERDGWEVVTALKADARLRDVPIVLMSAVAPHSSLLHAQGVSAALPKPFTMNELLFVVTRFVQPGGAEKPAAKAEAQSKQPAAKSAAGGKGGAGAKKSAAKSKPKARA